MKIHLCVVGRLRNGPEKELIDDYLHRFEKIGRAHGLGPVLVNEVEDKKNGGMLNEATLLQRVIPKGAKVIIAEINSESGIKVAEEINNNGGEAHFIETDVTSSSSVKSMVEKTVSIFGSPEILINNAGIVVFDDPLKLSDEDWKKCFSVDLDGVWYGCQHTLPYMLDKKKG